MIEVDVTIARKHFEVIVQEQFSGITGVYGANGSGKSTLLHAIAGLQAPTKGRISVGDQLFCDVEKGFHLPIQKRNIGLVFQKGRLFPHMTIRKNLEYGIKTTNENEIHKVIHQFELSSFLDLHPAKLSGGEQQRVAIARTLLSNPSVLLLDEPFSAIDQEKRVLLITLLKEYIDCHQLPTLFVSHQMEDIYVLTDRILEFKGGRCMWH